MSLGSQFERTFTSISNVLTGNGERSGISVAGLLAAAVTGGYLLLPPFDRRTRPKITRGPELQNEPPYSQDVLPGGAWLETPLGRIRQVD